jgi:ubiquinone/menaquinone biosynthesis C-methylase UbiE
VSTSADAAAWTRYWASGHLHSCPNAFAGNYGDELREFWFDFFGALPDGARVLDIGTGNGAVAFLARDAADARGRQFHIEGIDAARINPEEAAKRLAIPAGGVVFHGNTSSEHTGYPDGRFDAVSSQYAIEYSNVEETIGELARILSAGGRAAFVIHHTGSEALATTRLELKAFEYLSHEAPLVLAARQLLRRLATARGPRELAALAADRDSRRLQKDVEKELRRVVAYARAPGRNAAFLEGIAAQVAAAVREIGTKGVGPAGRRLAALEEEMAAHHERLRSIVRAARDRTGIETFCEQMAAAGFAAETPGELRRRGSDLLGWTLTATRP